MYIKIMWLYQEGQTQHVCNPISHKCSCERGYTPVTQVVMGMVMRVIMMMIASKEPSRR